MFSHASSHWPQLASVTPAQCSFISQLNSVSRQKEIVEMTIVTI